MRRGALTLRDQQMRSDRGGPHPQRAGSGFLVQAVPGPTASVVMGSVSSAVTQWDAVCLSS